ncbi:CHAT domain-containing protein [Chamaesiphon sp. OTE_75_metabat_556]|uniref:CHAT domain-containing protein n=1 Tax=Chamaesiphon sp. OTE_75_metabat_556 TaxID=2964692 RepID=UPI00286D4A93|nr:CHAT domain-containing protein [Chamaesiphon sp. OTE_75_metabat_556]
MNSSKLYLSILFLSILTILPATARNRSDLQRSTVASTIAESSSNSLLKSAQILNQRGADFLAAGKPDKALADWQQAHRLYTQAKDAQGTLGTKINQAQALQSLGFYRQALLTLQEVNTNLQQQPSSELKMQGLLGLGNSLRALRMLAQKTTIADRGINLGAKETLIQALDLATKRQDRAAIDLINLSLGNTLSSIDGTQQEQAAIDAYQKIAPDAVPLVRIQAQINLYRLASAQRTAPNTLVFLTNTRNVLDRIAPSRGTIFAYINLAETIKRNQAANRIDSEILIPVAKLLTTAVEQSRTLKDLRGEAQAIGTLGSLYALTGQHQEARKLTKQALAIAESLPAPDLAYRLDWQLGKIILANNPSDRDLETATSAYRQAINHLKSLRNDLNAIDADLQFSFRDSVEPVYREYVNLLLRDGKTISADNLANARDIIESLQVAELENFLRQGCLDTYTVPLEKIDRSAAVIYPIILPDRVATIASIPGQPLRYYSRKIPATTVEQTVAKLQQKIQDPDFNARQEKVFKQQSKQIYDLLLAPLAADLDRAKTKTLVFVLDGAFRNIPMSILYDGNKYLVENYNLALTPGLQLVPPQGSTDRIRSQALLGGISESSQGFSALPNAKSEIDSIGRIIPHQKLFNEQFNNKIVATNLVASNAPIVHFATHGQFSSNAEDTFILTWNNRLNLDQFSNLLKDRGTRSSNGIELLVLSACQTAAGDNRATLGLAGVAIRARAKSTIASLWSVDDKATEELMVNFYQNLATKNLNKGESLRQAQQSLLRNPKYQSPYFWAPFVLVGNWQ